MRALAHGVTLALASLVLVTGSTARAQPSVASQAPASPEEAARRHHERGTMFYNLGQFEDAIAEYRKAYEQKADAVFLYNIAQAYRQIGAHDKALFFYKRYLSTSPDAKNRRQVEERIAELESLLAAGARAKNAPPPEPMVPAAGDSGPSLVTPPAAVTATADTAAEKPLWRNWWVWAGAGAVVVAGVVTGIALASGGGRSRTELGTERFF